jgi:FKBP-type peptidyl-prolyl cis-trans isomerase FklB
MKTMKKGIFSALIMILAIGVSAQTKPASKKVATAAKKPAASATAPVMKNALDSFSYALGLSMAGFYREQGITDINTALVTKALKDVKTGKPLLDDAQINSCIVNFMQMKKGEVAGPVKKEGQAFLDSNKKQSGVVTLPSGLQYKVIKEGTGPKPTASDKVKVHYQGSLINGKVFDSSIQRGEPVTFGVSEVIPGWTEALQLMPVGSKWQLFIPSDLGYGDAGAGNDIKPGSTLLFDVELLEIVK